MTRDRSMNTDMIITAMPKALLLSLTQVPALLELPKRSASVTFQWKTN
jgi:hypothetical protein